MGTSLLLLLVACFAAAPHPAEVEAAPVVVDGVPAPDAAGVEAPEPHAPDVAGDPALVGAARALMGRPYRFGGRGRELDCMGLVFLAWQASGRGPWRPLSVMPTRLVGEGQLGEPVDGVAPVDARALPFARLAPGDVLFFLASARNPAEPALASLDGTDLWVWHMGMYAGGPDRSFVVGDHFAGEVVEPSLPRYLAAHREYRGVYAVRPPLR